MKFITERDFHVAVDLMQYEASNSFCKVIEIPYQINHLAMLSFISTE